jgi:hypothetical protein
MSMITVTSPDQGVPRIARWPDGGGIAIVSWRSADGHLYQQEVGDEQEAVHLLQSIEADDQLTLTSAQLRRRGIGPDS